MKILACDVSKANLVVFDGQNVTECPNEPKEIKKLLKAHPGWDLVCEPTSKYHLPLVNAAFESGHTVYLVNPREARNYKDSLSFRAKTDPLDARYLYEFVVRNKDLLRPYRPAPAQLLRLRELLGKRDGAVRSRTALEQIFQTDTVHEEVAQALEKLIEKLEKEMEEIAKSFQSYATLRSIPGVGPIAACALVYVLESKTFDSPEALVAFLGLDVRVRQSGVFKGQGKITKRGDPLLRFLVCFAGLGLLKSKFGAKKKLELDAQKRHFGERIVIAARKILRTAFHLHQRKERFNPEKWSWPYRCSRDP